ncbi:MAG: nitroreductase family protein [Pirellulales bacterium]|nr:nitroreductase family protein [Pirellulales bacterium]
MGMTFDERGRPSADAALCTGCGACARICPDGVLAIEDGLPRAGTGGFMGCIACGHCACVCPTGAMRVEGRGMRADDVVGIPPADARATADALEALLLARRSVRQFTDREVDRATVDRILAMVSTAPMGIPPHEVSVLVFHGRDKVRAFAADAAVSFERAAKFFNPVTLTLMRPFLGKSGHALLRDFVRPLMQALVSEHARGRDAFTYGAPLAMLFHTSAVGDPTDCHIAATYAMLAAESLGLGSCLLGTAQAFERDKTFRAKYGIPPGNKIGLALTIGHPAVHFTRAVRRRLASVRFA